MDTTTKQRFTLRNKTTGITMDTSTPNYFTTAEEARRYLPLFNNNDLGHVYEVVEVFITYKTVE